MKSTPSTNTSKDKGFWTGITGVIIGIAIIIGGMWYFSIHFVPRTTYPPCMFGIEMHCKNQAINTSEGLISFELSNELTENIYLSTIVWKEQSQEAYKPCEETYINGTKLGEGRTVHKRELISITCKDQEIKTVTKKGEKARIEIEITYNKGDKYDSNYINNQYGEIYAKAK